jgi:hypothetical protein
MTKLNIITQVWRPLIASLLMALVIFFLTRYWQFLSQPLIASIQNDFIANIIVLILMVCAGVFIYLGFIFIFAKRQILSSYKLLRNV